MVEAYPGPWKRGYSTEPLTSQPPASAIYAQGGRWVCNISEKDEPSEQEIANADLIEQAHDLRSQRDQLLAACRGVVRALESQEWKDWEGQAMTMQIRNEGLNAKGYTGEQFMPAVRDAIAACEPDG